MAAQNPAQDPAQNPHKTHKTPAHTHTPLGKGVLCAGVLSVVRADVPSDLVQLRDAVRNTFGGGLTWLVVKHNGQWIGGKHRGGGVFRG